MIAILGIQVATFIALGALFVAQGQWRLGGAQLLLAAVQAVIYSGKMA
jgi:predicted membrane-bound dolichyl-phosphate-mannose-protein mannosyltransferase